MTGTELFINWYPLLVSHWPPHELHHAFLWWRQDGAVSLSIAQCNNIKIDLDDRNAVVEAYHFRNQCLPCIQTYYVNGLNFTYHFLFSISYCNISHTYTYTTLIYLPCYVYNHKWRCKRRCRGWCWAGEVTQLDMSGDSDHAQSSNTQLNMKPHRASLCFHIDQTTSTNPCKTQETHFLSKNKLILSEDKTLKWSYLVNFSCECNLSKHSHSTESLHLSHLILNPTCFIFILLLTICKFCIAIRQQPELLYFSNDLKKNIYKLLFTKQCCWCWILFCSAQINLITIKICENLFSRSIITEYNPRVTSVSSNDKYQLWYCLLQVHWFHRTFHFIIIMIIIS